MSKVRSGFLNWYKTHGSGLSDRQAVQIGLSETAKSLPFYGALTVVVWGAASGLGWLGQILAVIYSLVLLTVIAEQVFSSILGFVTLVLAIGKIREASASLTWVALGALLTTLNASIYVTFAYLIGKGARWL
jgi:hypothetical protein